MLTIRLATTEDLDQVVALRMDFLREMQPDALASEPEVERLTRRYVEHKLPSGEFMVWFAEEDGRIVGTGGLVLQHGPPTFRNASDLHAYILNMYTIPECRGRGIATMLLRHIIDYVRTTRAKLFSLIHAVVNGISESQNNRCRFAHRIPPVTRWVAWSMWWWLFQ